MPRSAHRKQADLARTLLTRGERAALSRRRPLRVYADLAVIHALLATGVLLAVHAAHPLAKLLAFLLIGTRQYALFLIGHDGIHRNLHPRPTVNDRITRWLVLAPLGMMLENGRTNHLAHHRHLGSEDDPDRYLHRAGDKRTLPQFLFFLTGLATFFKTVWKVTRPRSVALGCGKENNARLRRELSARAAVLAVQAVLFAVFVALGSWADYVLFWAAPVYFLVFLPDEIRAFCDHAHPVVPDADADDRRLITYDPPWFERLLFSPVHMNYHAEHHLWPFIPYYNLPRAHRLVRARCDGRIIIRTSYLRFLWRYARSLPLTAPASSAASSWSTGAPSRVAEPSA